MLRTIATRLLGRVRRQLEQLRGRVAQISKGRFPFLGRRRRLKSIQADRFPRAETDRWRRILRRSQNGRSACTMMTT